MNKKIRVKHKPTGKLYEFNLDNPPRAGIEKILFTVAINKQDVVLKQPGGELYVRLDDLEIEELEVS